MSVEELRVLVRLSEWPMEKVFPCLDLMRLAVTHPDVAQKVASAEGMRLVDGESSGVQLALRPDAPMAVQLCALRFLSNCYTHSPLRAQVVPLVRG